MAPSGLPCPGHHCQQVEVHGLFLGKLGLWHCGQATGLGMTLAVVRMGPKHETSL